MRGDERPITIGPISITVTSQFLKRADDASSKPMTPPPIKMMR